MREHHTCIRCLAPALLLLLLGCAPATFDDVPPRGSAFEGWEGGPPACPIDPDCHIGGDCGLYDCPDHWECQEVETDLERCINPGPGYPDDGDWECEDRAGQTVCRREGDYPDSGGDGEWSCESTAEFVECTSDHPSYPDDGADGPWSCRFEHEFRVCERRTGDPDDGGGACSGPGCDGGGTPDDGGGDCSGGGCEPPVCEATDRPTARFVDDRDGDDNGQIYALSDGRRDRSCATVFVDVTGYYSIFDTDIAESCSDQLDETGFLTVHNGCNPEGLPREHNVGSWYVVEDLDNGGSCDSDAACGAGQVCRAGNSHGRCCVPADPVFMGTFLLTAGEPNEICLNHLCPLWLDGAPGDALINADCRGSVNSIHFRLDAAAFVCLDDAPPPGSCG